MKKYKISLLIILLPIILFIPGISRAADYSAGAIIGYNGGPGFQLSGMVGNFAQDFPLNLQILL